MTLHLKISDRVIVKKNSKRFFFRGKKPVIIPSKAYERFKNFAIAEIMGQRYTVKFTGQVHISYTFYIKGKMDADIDNLIASINDVLQDASVLEDDRLVTSIEAKKIMGCRNFETEISITGGM